MEQHVELEGYLDSVCAEVKAREMHKEIRRELGSHLEELILEKEGSGNSREQAAAWAIAQMGDPHTLGKDLHRIHKPRVPWGLLTAVVLFSGISLLMMGSADIGLQGTGFPIGLIERQAVYIGMGIILMSGFYFIDFRKFKKFSWLLYGSSLAAIIMNYAWGIEGGGIRRYLGFLGFYIDFTAYSPFLLVIALAAILSKHTIVDKFSRRWNEMLKVAVLLLPMLVYIAVSSYPELVVYSLVSLVLYVWITRKWIAAIGLGGLLSAGGVIYFFNSLSFKDRLMGALASDPNDGGSGYIYRLIQETVASAGWRGQGFGAMQQDLPYIYSDLLPAYLINCFGWGGGLLMLAVVAWFFIKLLSAIRVIREPYGQAVVLALALLLAIRLLYGIALVSGRVVMVTIPIPFLSYGNHILIEYASLGLLMGIYRRKDIVAVAESSAAGEDSCIKFRSNPGTVRVC